MKKIIILSFLFIFLFGCSKTNSVSNVAKENGAYIKLKIIATMFPVYDFAKSIGGEKTQVSLLTPPGSEPHDYEPTASDLININNADIFVYTGKFMEVWVAEMLKGVTNDKIDIVDTSNGTKIFEDDPHIWLDFEHNRIMAKNIADAMIKKDPSNKDYYEKNLKDLLTKIDKIDNDYFTTLSTCKTKNIVFGGHYAFGYLVRRFNLEYVAAQGFSPDSEPTANDLIKLVRHINEENIGYIFYEELSSTKVPETISKETGAKMLLLSNLESLTKDEVDSGKTFIDAMYENLSNIKIGLDCK